MDVIKTSQTDDLAINPAVLGAAKAEKPAQTDSWTEEEVKFLIENRKNMSMSMIAFEIGKTKGAIAGKLHRLGIKADENLRRAMLSEGVRRSYARRSGINCNLVSTKKGVDGWKAIATVYKRGEKATPKHMIEPPVGILGGVGVKLWALENHHCKWVVGEPSDLTCCGQNRLKDSPYCQDHHNIAYKPRRMD